MMTYELIDQTGEQFGRNRQWLIVISDGHRKRGFCTIPLWEDFPAGQLKADAEQVLNALNERDELRRKLFCAEDENARLCAQNVELAQVVKVAKDAPEHLDRLVKLLRGANEHPEQIRTAETLAANLRYFIAAAESEAANA